MTDYGIRTGVAEVRARLVFVQENLRALGVANPSDPAVIREAAALAREGLDHVTAWLDAISGKSPGAPFVVDDADGGVWGRRLTLERPAEAMSATLLTSVLSWAIEMLAELGEQLEDDDPVAHFDAVQAVGLATAVLEAAFQRLLRAGLARPRPVNLLHA